MSVDTTSVPPWKQALLERKRRNEVEDRRRQEEENERLARMPAWKRDILLKKQHQRNSMVFLSQEARTSLKDRSPERVRPTTNDRIKTVDVTVSSADTDVNITNHAVINDSYMGGDTIDGGREEHITPIAQNPWYKTGAVRKLSHGQQVSTRHSSNEYDITYLNSQYNSLPHNHNSWSQEPAGAQNIATRDNAIPDDTEQEEGEFEYGRGFVSKLLNKFKRHMSSSSTREPVLRSSPKQRSHSLDNILDDFSDTSGQNSQDTWTERIDNGGSRAVSSTKPISMESLPTVQPPGQEESLHLKDRFLFSSDITDNSDASADSPRSDSLGRERYSANLSPRSDDVFGEPTQSEPINKENKILVEPNIDTLATRRGSNDEILERELPKPNFVSSTRTLFEEQIDSNKKRRAPEPPKVSQVTSSMIGESNSGRSTHTTLSVAMGPNTVTMETASGEVYKSAIDHTNDSSTVAILDSHTTPAVASRPEEGDEQKTLTSTAGSSTQSAALNNTASHLAASKPVANQLSNAPGYKTVVTEQAIQNIRAAGKSWFFGTNGEQYENNTTAQGEVHSVQANDLGRTDVQPTNYSSDHTDGGNLSASSNYQFPNTSHLYQSQLPDPKPVQSPADVNIQRPVHSISLNNKNNISLTGNVAMQNGESKAENSEPVSPTKKKKVPTATLR